MTGAEGINFNTVRINDKDCERCYQCVDCCPNHALTLDKGIFVHNAYLCSYCYTCMGFCTNIEILEM